LVAVTDRQRREAISLELPFSSLLKFPKPVSTPCALIAATVSLSNGSRNAGKGGAISPFVPNAYLWKVWPAISKSIFAYGVVPAIGTDPLPSLGYCHLMSGNSFASDGQEPFRAIWAWVRPSFNKAEI
jgi:hypothetical protein